MAVISEVLGLGLVDTVLGDVDKDVVSMVSKVLLLNRGDLLSAHGILSEIEEDVMSSALVMGGLGVVVRIGVSVLAGLELVTGGLGDSLDGAGGVHVSHELEHGGTGNESADSADLLDDSTNGVGILVGGSLHTGLGLGDDESPNGNRKGVEDRSVLAHLVNLVRGSESVVLALELGSVLGESEVTEGHVAETDDSGGHDNLGEIVDSLLVLLDLHLVLLHVLEEFDGVGGALETLILNDFLDVVLLGHLRLTVGLHISKLLFINYKVLDLWL